MAGDKTKPSTDSEKIEEPAMKTESPIEQSNTPAPEAPGPSGESEATATAKGARTTPPAASEPTPCASPETVPLAGRSPSSTRNAAMQTFSTPPEPTRAKWNSPCCWWCIAIAIAALVLSMFAMATSKTDELAKAIAEILTPPGRVIASLPWDGDIARLIYVMSICGTLGASAHRFVIAESQRPARSGAGRLKRWWWSILGSLLVGTVAANVLHFPLAAVFDYDHLLKRGPENDKPFLSMIALALLAGYAGPALLDALAKKFQDSVAAKLEQRLKNKEDMLNHTLRFLLQDILTRRINPNATDCELLRAKYEEAQRIEVDDGLEMLAPLDAVIAGYYCLEKGEEDALRYREAVRYLEYAEKKIAELTSDGQKWAARNLLALAYHYDHVHQRDWFGKTATKHEEALKANPTPIQEAITRVNLAFAKKDAGDLPGALRESQESLKLAEAFSKEYAAVRDVAHLCCAAIYTLQALPTATSTQPPDFTAAVAELEKIEQPETIKYLLTDDSIEESVLNAWRASPAIPARIKEILD